MKTLPTPTIIKGTPPAPFSKSDRVAMDVELFQLDDKKLHRPAGYFGSIAATADGENVYLLQDETRIQEFLDLCKDAVWIFHNAQFDIAHLRRWAKIENRKRLWDTMLIEKVMWSGYYEGFSLADVARRYLDVYLEKATRKEFEDATEMTPEMEVYAAKDVTATWRVYQEQRKIISDDDLNIYKQIDLPAMWCVLGFKGVKIDAEKWLALADKNDEIAKGMKAGMSYNPASPVQVKKKLLEEGEELESTGKTELKRLKHSDTAKEVLDYRTFAKRASTYGKKWLQNHLEPDGRVHANFNIIGAETGRLSSSSPNLQQIPIRDTNEYRKCFIADVGNKLVDADWSAQEVRIAAYLSQDPYLINIFKKDKDPYIELASEIYGEKITKSDPRRAKIKAIVLGSIYGLSAYGLAYNEGIPKDEAEVLMDRTFEILSGLKQWMDKQRWSKPFVQTIYGRKIWINPYSEQGERNALNSPVQGSGADALKIAMVRFCKKWEGNPIIAPVHDELLLEVAEVGAEVAAKMLEEVMVEVASEMHEGIPAKVDVHIADSWADAH